MIGKNVSTSPHILWKDTSILSFSLPIYLFVVKEQLYNIYNSLPVLFQSSNRQRTGCLKWNLFGRRSASDGRTDVLHITTHIEKDRELWSILTTRQIQWQTIQFTRSNTDLNTKFVLHFEHFLSKYYGKDCTE